MAANKIHLINAHGVYKVSCHFIISFGTSQNLKNFVSVDHRVKVCCFLLFRCEEYFINWSTVLYGTLKLNKVQLYMKHIPLPC